MIAGFAGLVALGKPVLKIDAERTRANERAEELREPCEWSACGIVACAIGLGNRQDGGAADVEPVIPRPERFANWGAASEARRGLWVGGSAHSTAIGFPGEPVAPTIGSGANT